MRTALVTGGTLRVGAAIAARLRAEGWQVLTSSHRPDAGADFTADLTDSAEAIRLYAAVLERLGRPPEALVNNAAILTGEEGAIEALNFLAAKKLTILMSSRENGRGSVVNILDTRILGEARADEGTYARSKRQLLAYTLSSAEMFAETLSVNGVAPGPVMVPTAVRERAGKTLVGRPRSEDVAAAVAFLLGAPSVTGAIIPVDGGQHLL